MMQYIETDKRYHVIRNTVHGDVQTYCGLIWPKSEALDKQPDKNLCVTCHYALKINGASKRKRDRIERDNQKLERWNRQAH